MQGGSDLGEFLDEAIHGPQAQVIGAIGTAAAQLVVEDDPAVFGEGLERLEVVVGETGTAVQAQQRGGAGFVTDRAVPNPAARDPDIALVGVHLLVTVPVVAMAPSSAWYLR